MIKLQKFSFTLRRLQVPFFFISTSNSTTFFPTPPQVIIDLFSVTIVLPFIGFHIHGIVIFCVWLFILCNDFEIHLWCLNYWHSISFVCGIVFFSIPWYKYTTIWLFIHQLRFILVASTFWLSCCYEHLYTGCCVDITYKILW